MKKETKRPHIVISTEMHEHIRYEAFKRRISFKEVVQEALRYYYNWNDDSSKSKKEEEDASPKNKRPSSR